MQKEIIFENEIVKLDSTDKNVYLTVKKKETTISDISGVFGSLPQIKLIDYNSLKKMIRSETNKRVLIGELLERFSLEVSIDKMTAYVKVHVERNEYILDREKIHLELKAFLRSRGVVYFNEAFDFDEAIRTKKKMVVSMGKKPGKGIDSKISYYNLSKKVPKVKCDGSPDFYNLEIINNVKKDEWVGEKTFPARGESGYTIFGDEILSSVGRDLKLKFDNNSVYSTIEGDKEIIRAKFNGAVTVKNGKISVEKHYVVHGDVNYETGNIFFDGSITIHGTIEDNFDVIATGDITINAKQGVGAIGRIISHRGSVFIKGGVNGKGRGEIIAGENIYLMYANECTLEATGEIHICKYAYDSNMVARKVVLDSISSIVVGGKIEVHHSFIAGAIGNSQERKTQITVNCFDRNHFNQQLKSTKLNLSKYALELNRLSSEILMYENGLVEQLVEKSYEYSNLIDQYEQLHLTLSQEYRQLKYYEEALKIKGEGEIVVKKSIYPKTIIKFRKKLKNITEHISCSFYYDGYKINSI